MTFEGRDGPPVIRTSRLRRIAKIAIPSTAALGAGAVIAGAAIPGSDGSVGFCYQSDGGGSVRVVDPASGCVTGSGETMVTVNQKGPTGPAGPAGAAGPAGPAGPAGASGGGGASTYPAAASDYLLELDGIKGESLDKKHPGAIDVESFSWGAAQTGSSGSGGGGGAGKVHFQDLSFHKHVDAATPLLFRRCATGEHIKKATLTVRKAGGTQVEYLKITLTDVLVSSVHDSSQEPRGDGETESVTLSFAKMTVDYSPIKADGSAGAPIHAGWDVKANKTL
jgi:type VI secretion system secreted protein Hcp